MRKQKPVKLYLSKRIYVNHQRRQPRKPKETESRLSASNTPIGRVIRNANPRLDQTWLTPPRLVLPYDKVANKNPHHKSVQSLVAKPSKPIDTVTLFRTRRHTLTKQLSLLRHGSRKDKGDMPQRTCGNKRSSREPRLKRRCAAPGSRNTSIPKFEILS